MEASLCGSQNFCLKLSQDSTISDTFHTNEDVDVVEISDSSPNSTCSSSKNVSKPGKYPAISNKVYIVESSDSDCTDVSDEKLLYEWESKKKSSFINQHKERYDLARRNNISYTSDESSSTSLSQMENCITNSNTTGSSYITATTGSTLKHISKTNVQYLGNMQKETNLFLSHANSTNNNSPKSNKSPKSTAKSVKASPFVNKAHNDLTKNLSRKDAKNIIRNIKSTKLIYESPKVQKQDNSVLFKGIDDNVVHPAISPTNKLTTVNKIINETPVSSDSDIILDSQANKITPYKTLISKSCNTLHLEENVEAAGTELSPQKKKQISQWLLTNSPEAQSDSSFSVVPPSGKQDISSGNSSLERLEMNYETPNNRGKIRQQQANHEGIRIDDTHKKHVPTLHGQTTINDYIQRSKNNGLELLSQSAKKSHTSNTLSTKITNTTTNAVQKVDIKDCADILDQLYGKSWRAKADVLFANSEPRKHVISTKTRGVQTERKIINKARLYVSDSDEDSDTSLKDLKLDNKSTTKNTKKNTNRRNNFINDESSSDGDSESLYQTALTNLRASNSSEQFKPAVPPSARRILAICDTDTEDEDKDNKNTNNQVSNIRGRKLSFSSDDNSSTSEFDPGDDVPPKPVVQKKYSLKKSNQIKSLSENRNYEKHKSFLGSLSESVPIANVHPEAKKYRLDYKNNKESLYNYLYKLYNEKVFDNNLPEDMPIEWNVRMRGTAGFCYNKKSVKALGGIVKSSRIVLSTKVLDTPDRLRDTLIHEMCHAAAWLINDVSDGHGPFWTQWANKAMKVFPELPPIRRCHDYKIKTKFTYKCVGCGYSIGRHSKSLDIERKRCGHCYGKFELLLNKTTKSGTVQVQTPKRELSAFALYVKENYNSVKKQRNVKHGEVMKVLGQQFSAIKIARKQENNENDPIILG